MVIRNLSAADGDRGRGRGTIFLIGWAGVVDIPNIRNYEITVGATVNVLRVGGSKFFMGMRDEIGKNFK